MKRTLAIFVLLLLLVSMTACGKATKGTDIPDVFGISYTDATDILEAEGFEVSAVETEVGNISERLLYPLEKVSKGTVFKVDNYILDNLGNLTKDYDVYYDGELVSEDKSVVIYYAKDDYVLEKEEAENDNTITDDTLTQETVKNEETPEASEIPEKEPEKSSDDNGLNPDFKVAMDSYESFMDEYVAFMKKYKANPSDLNLLADYADYMSEYADFVEDFEDWGNEEMNATETAYYIEVQSRVSKKLLEVAS